MVDYDFADVMIFDLERTGNGEEDYKEYRVKYPFGDFIVKVTDDELAKIAKIAIDIVNEISLLLISDTDKYKFKQLVDEVMRLKDENKYSDFTMLMETIQNEEIKRLIVLAAETMRVGGMYYMLICRPLISSAIFAVVRNILCDIDNKYILKAGAYHVFRVILKMQGEEIKEV